MADMPTWLAPQVDAARQERADALAAVGAGTTGVVTLDEHTPRQPVGHQRGDGRLPRTGRAGDDEETHGHAHGVAPHRGHPDAYRAAASSNDSPS